MVENQQKKIDVIEILNQMAEDDSEIAEWF